MNEFDYDAYQKKLVARSARNRKSGGGHRCSLRQDYMTKKELEKMNGEVKTWDMNAPLSFGRFQEMSGSVQAQYITHLCTQYSVGKKAIAQMMGVSPFVLGSYLQQNNPAIKFTHAKNRRSREEIDRWNAFLAGGEDRNAEETEQEPEQRPETGRVIYDTMTIERSGKISLPEVIRMLRSFVGDGDLAKIEIRCTCSRRG